MAAIVDPRSPPQPPARLLTAADLAALPSDLPSGTVRYELDDGVLVMMSPTGSEHGKCVARIVFALMDQGERRGHGQVRTGEIGLVLRRNPDRVVGADAAYFAVASLPLRLGPEGYIETVPDLVVEVASKHDSGPALERKVAEYLAAGAGQVWVVDPAARTLAVHRPGQPPVMASAPEVLAADDLIAGFRLSLGELFA